MPIVLRSAPYYGHSPDQAGFYGGPRVVIAAAGSLSLAGSGSLHALTTASGAGHLVLAGTGRYPVGGPGYLIFEGAAVPKVFYQVVGASHMVLTASGIPWWVPTLCVSVGAPARYVIEVAGHPPYQVGVAGAARYQVGAAGPPARYQVTVKAGRKPC